MSIFGNPVFLEVVDIAVSPSGEPLPPSPETASIDIYSSLNGISGIENVFGGIAKTQSVAQFRDGQAIPATAAMISATTGDHMFKSSPVEKLHGTCQIYAMSNDYGVSSVSRGEAFIAFEADTSFHRAEDAGISGFICPGLNDASGAAAGGGGGGKIKYDIRYKRNLIKF